MGFYTMMKMFLNRNVKKCLAIALLALVPGSAVPNSLELLHKEKQMTQLLALRAKSEQFGNPNVSRQALANLNKAREDLDKKIKVLQHHIGTLTNQEATE